MEHLLDLHAATFGLRCGDGRGLEIKLQLTFSSHLSFPWLR